MKAVLQPRFGRPGVSVVKRCIPGRRLIFGFLRGAMGSGFAFSAVQADEVRILEDPVDAFVTRLEVIESASKTLDLAYFNWVDDESGYRVFHAMQQAGARGVRIRMVLDAITHQLPVPCWQWLDEDPDFELRFFNPLHLQRAGTAQYRLHDKLLIADGVRFITGGRNISNLYFVPDDPKPYLDRDIYVEGEVVNGPANYFDHLWENSHPPSPAEKKRCFRDAASGGVPAYTGRRAVRSRNASVAAKKRFRERATAADRHPLLSETAVRSPIHTIPGKHLRFVHDHLPKNPENSTAAAELYRILEGARNEVIIQTPYLIPTEKLNRILVSLAERGVRIVIYTNSLKTTDNILAQSGFLESQDSIVAAGIDLWKYYGPKSMHCKSLVIDGRIGIIGSFNLDPRSENLNTESFVAVEDRVFAAELLTRMRRDEKLYRRVEKNEAGSLRSRLLGEPGAGLHKNLPMPLLRLLSPVYRHLL